MFKADVFLATESMEWDEKEQAYIGYDPDTYQDYGIVNTYQADTLENLKAKIKKDLTLLDDAIRFEGRLQIQVEGEHDYRTPKEERVPFQEIYTIIFSKVQIEPIDAVNIFPEIEE